MSSPTTGARRAPLPSLAALAAGLWLAVACVDTTAQQNTAQALVDLGDEVNAMRQDNAALQQQVDSLATVVARQDTLLRQLAGVAGVPVPPR